MNIRNEKTLNIPPFFGSVRKISKNTFQRKDPVFNRGG